MATLSVLSYNLMQGLKMKASNNSGTTSAITTSSSSSGTNSGGTTAIAGGCNGITSNLSKAFNKITVQNVLSENNCNSLNISNNNNANTIVRKIKDFGMFGTVNNASTENNATSNGKSTPKHTKVVPKKRPLAEVKTNPEEQPHVQATQPKKSKQNKEPPIPKTSKKVSEHASRVKLPVNFITLQQALVKPAGTPGRKGLPLPMAVARRNARERNRVKQVNNGFAALRERIPEEVAEAFEAHNAGRGAAKKLSKVETLRMAVEYIRSLERLLGFDYPLNFDSKDAAGLFHSSSSSGEESFTIVKDEFDVLSPSVDEHFDDSLSNYDYDDEYFSSATNSFLLQNSEEANQQLDLLPNVTTLNGLQYIRIPGTNTYQLLTPDLFAGNSNSPTNSNFDDEQQQPQFNTLIDANCESPAAAELHAMPPSSINNTAPAGTTTKATPTTPTTMSNATKVTRVNNVNVVNNSGTATILSRSPVPQATMVTTTAATMASPSPLTAHTTTLHHNQPATLSPASQQLLQTCATNTNADCNTVNSQFVTTPIATTTLKTGHLLTSGMIKREFIESDFVATTTSPTTTTTLIYQTTGAVMSTLEQQQHHQQQQQKQQEQHQLLLEHATLSMSPPLDRIIIPTSTACRTTTPAAMELHTFYEHEQNRSFYENSNTMGSTSIAEFKKEYNDMLLDSSSSAADVTAAASLSDESMMEAIDWWEAHTPKSDGGSVIM